MRPDIEEITRVLIVEDEDDIRSGICEVMKASYSVIEARNGKEAIEKTKDLFPMLNPGLVLLDIKLPDMSGIEVLKQIKEHDPALCVIMVTAMKDTALAVEALSEGASGYVTKPFTAEELLRKIGDALDINEYLRQFNLMNERLEQWKIDFDGRAHDAGASAPLRLIENDPKELLEDLENKVREKFNITVPAKDKRARILAVDDEEDIRSGVKELLQGKYEVETAGSGAEAVSRFGSGEFDLCLLDIRLPDISGIELIKKLSEMNGKTVIIMVTAMKDISITVEAVRAGARDYITKPFTANDITATVEKQLKLKDQRERLAKLREELDKLVLKQ
jgi:DNA-binding NtrC family response regulator